MHISPPFIYLQVIHFIKNFCSTHRVYFTKYNLVHKKARRFKIKTLSGTDFSSDTLRSVLLQTSYTIQPSKRSMIVHKTQSSVLSHFSAFFSRRPVCNIVKMTAFAISPSLFLVSFLRLLQRNSIIVIICLIPFPPEYSSAAENTSDSCLNVYTWLLRNCATRALLQPSYAVTHISASPYTGCS